MLRQGDQVDFFISSFMRLSQQFEAYPGCIVGIWEDNGGKGKC